MLVLLFAVCFTAIAVSFVTYFQSRKQVTSAADSAAKAPGNSAAPAQSAVSKVIEVTGFRVTEDAKQKAQVSFVVVNHSEAEFVDLAGTVALKAAASRADEEPVATFGFKLKSLGPYMSRDMQIPIQTKLRAYELPDWQFLKAEVQITSPQ
jgi:hypothetical protein